MKAEITIDDRKFILIATTKRIFQISRQFSGNMVYWIHGKYTTPIGFSYNIEHAEELIKDYFNYSFCLESQLSENSFKFWHIRKLISGRRKLIVSDTGSLCGRIEKGQCCDMFAPVNLDQWAVCEECGWIYWNELLQRAST